MKTPSLLADGALASSAPPFVAARSPESDSADLGEDQDSGDVSFGVDEDALDDDELDTDRLADDAVLPQP